MNADGSGLEAADAKEETDLDRGPHKPSWSPDGKRIAFQRYNTTAQPAAVSAIYVMNADGTHLRRLTPRSMDASDPRWSRDGTKIAFNDYAEDVPNKSANVYTIRPDGTSLKKVTHYTGGTKRAFVNDWSPDGRQIVYHLHRRCRQRSLSCQRRREKHPRADPPRPSGEPAPLHLGNSPLTSPERPAHLRRPSGAGLTVAWQCSGTSPRDLLYVESDVRRHAVLQAIRGRERDGRDRQTRHDCAADQRETDAATGCPQSEQDG